MRRAPNAFPFERLADFKSARKTAPLLFLFRGRIKA